MVNVSTNPVVGKTGNELMLDEDCKFLDNCPVYLINNFKTKQAGTHYMNNYNNGDVQFTSVRK